LIGNFANGGREWQPKGEPERVNVHDFADRALGEIAKAIPNGVYDLSHDEGGVSVGDTADTAESRWSPSGAGGTRWATPVSPRPPP
jgi:hypothetical protein